MKLLHASNQNIFSGQTHSPELTLILKEYKYFKQAIPLKMKLLKVNALFSVSL